MPFHGLEVPLASEAASESKAMAEPSTASANEIRGVVLISAPF